jgi:hypothetical protein
MAVLIESYPQNQSHPHLEAVCPMSITLGRQIWKWKRVRERWFPLLDIKDHLVLELFVLSNQTKKLHQPNLVMCFLMIDSLVVRCHWV